MKRNKRKGTKTMLLGLVLIGVAMAVTGYNLCEQQHAAESSETVLTQLELQPAEQPEEPSLLVLTDESGREVNWPVDASGAPMPWPVENGEPVPVVIDAQGKAHDWHSLLAPEDVPDSQQLQEEATTETGIWTTEESGAILPWIKGEDGQTIPWPTDSEGSVLDWQEIHSRWKEIVLQLLPYQLYAEESEEPVFVSHPDVEMPTQEIDGNQYIGVLEIPKLGLSLPVMADWSYPKFKKAPCRYVGSAYTGDLIIAAHNYDRHFGKIKTLELGDAVKFTDVEGNVFNYAVSGFETLAKKDVEPMEEGEWDLTLFTCTPGGAKRVTVRCVQRSYLWQKQ